MMWKEKKRKDGKIYYYNVITHKIHPYFRGGDLASKKMYPRKPVGLDETKQSHPYLRGGGLTVSRMMYPRRQIPIPEGPDEEPELLQQANVELNNLICPISFTLIADQPVSIGSIAGGNPIIYSQSAITRWFQDRRARYIPLTCPQTTQRVTGALTPEPSRMRDTARFVERIVNTRYQGDEWEELRLQCNGYLILIRQNGNNEALEAQEEARIHERDRRERERALAEAGGDAPAIAFAIV